MKRFFVVHEDGRECGLRPVEFDSRQEAREARDEWNKEIPGHRVVIVNELAIRLSGGGGNPILRRPRGEKSR